VSRCEACEAGIEAVPFTCRSCGGVFCPEHRLREQHDCQAPVRDARVRP
jgi:predicted nucleic acid binding AN1-type Zn finger protein